MKLPSLLKFCILFLFTSLFFTFSLKSEAYYQTNKNGYQEFIMLEEHFNKMLDKKYNIVIGCYQNGKTYIPEKINDQIYCKGRNIILPKLDDFKHFVDLYFTTIKTEVGNKRICNELCQKKLANRFAIINFESGFDAYAKSPTNDYGYIQIHDQKWFLGKIKESLQLLDQRFQEHTETVCKNIYKVDLNNQDQLFKCLAMRHNGQKTINNSYSNRALTTSYFYLNYFKDYYTE